MELKSIFELSGTQNSLGFYNTPDVIITLFDNQDKEYRLELKNRKIFLNILKNKISWCNGWQLNSSKLIQTKPSFVLVEDPKTALSILEEASKMLNSRFFPSVNFPQYGHFKIGDVKSLKPIFESFEDYSINLINDKTVNLSLDDRDYLKNISLQQLISVLNCFELEDKFIVREKIINESKVLHKFNYEYTLDHADKFDFPLKETYGDFYKIGVNFQVFSDINYNINDIVTSRLTFDYFHYNNNYVFNYTGINQTSKPKIDLTKSTSQKDSRCFVVTAVTGDVNHPIVEEFREFRDDYLLKYNFGIYFVSKYYEYSPPLAKFIRNSKITRLLFLNVFIKPIYFFLNMLKKLNK
jgi:hypothetical protein